MPQMMGMNVENTAPQPAPTASSAKTATGLAPALEESREEHPGRQGDRHDGDELGDRHPAGGGQEGRHRDRSGGQERRSKRRAATRLPNPEKVRKLTAPIPSASS